MAQRHLPIADRHGVSQSNLSDHRLRGVDAGLDKTGRTRERPIDLVSVSEADLKDALLFLDCALGERCSVEAGVRFCPSNDVNERYGTGLCIVEQNVPATLKLVDRAIILKSGRVVFDGSAREIEAQTDFWQWF